MRFSRSTGRIITRLLIALAAVSAAGALATAWTLWASSSPARLLVLLTIASVLAAGAAARLAAQVQKQGPRDRLNVITGGGLEPLIQNAPAFICTLRGPDHV